MNITKLISVVFCLLVIPIVLLSFVSCGSSGPEPIVYGEDNCSYCNMTIVDQSFGTELVTKKGKKYKFDSIECLAAFHIKGEVPKEDVNNMWVTDNLLPETFMNTNKAVFVRSESMRSPMGVGLVAYSSRAAAEKSIEESGGIIVDWPGLTDIVNNTWSITAR